MLALGIVLGVLIAFLGTFVLINLMPPNPPDNIITGQRWFISGIGPVEITKVLNTGNFSEFGVGVNIQYVMKNGKVGHCTANSLKNNARILPGMIETSAPNTGKVYHKTVEMHKEKMDQVFIYDNKGKQRVINTPYRDI